MFRDFNARAGLKPDYIPGEDNTDIPVMRDLCNTDTVATWPRGNMDTNTNTYGDKLLGLCKSVPLRICNCRKLGDILGSFTCYKTNGQSTVDYCIVSPKIYHLISTFEVNQFLPNILDHCSLSVTIQTKYFPKQSLPEYKFIQKPPKN